MTDVLLYRSEQGQWQTQTLRRPRIASQNTHGTGCTFILGDGVIWHWATHYPDAVKQARAYILQAIERCRAVQGQGYYSLNHGFSPRAMVVLNDHCLSKMLCGGAKNQPNNRVNAAGYG